MSMQINDAFREMGLSASATADEAKAVYRRIASQWHPDRNPSHQATARMKALNAAYEVVRKHLQQAGQRPSAAAAQDKPASNASTAHAARSARPGAGQASANARRGRDIVRTLRLNLFEAAFGCQKTLSGSVTDPCEQCAGAGVYPPGADMLCTDCKGEGHAKESYFFYVRKVVCTGCQGRGHVPSRCDACQGTGKSLAHSWAVEVKVPPGVTQGKQIRAAGLGGRAGRLAARGDLHITLSIDPHPLFTLDGANLRVELPITFWKWQAGGTLTVPTLDGVTQVQMAPRCQELQIPGQGWPALGRPGAEVTAAERRALTVRLRVLEPGPLTQEQKQLLEALDQASAHEELERWRQSLSEWTQTKPERRFRASKGRTGRKAQADAAGE